MHLLTDDDLEQQARNTLVLMNEGIPYDAIVRMHPRMKAAFLRALASLCSDDDEPEEVVVGGVN